MIVCAPETEKQLQHLWGRGYSQNAKIKHSKGGERFKKKSDNQEATQTKVGYHIRDVRKNLALAVKPP